MVVQPHALYATKQAYKTGRGTLCSRFGGVWLVLYCASITQCCVPALLLPLLRIACVARVQTAHSRCLWSSCPQPVATRHTQTSCAGEQAATHPLRSAFQHRPWGRRPWTACSASVVPCSAASTLSRSGDASHHSKHPCLSSALVGSQTVCLTAHGHGGAVCMGMHADNMLVDVLGCATQPFGFEPAATTMHFARMSLSCDLTSSQ